MDVLPIANAMESALDDNPAADADIRMAVGETIRLNHEQAQAFSKAPRRGAVQPPTDWTAASTNAATDQAWDLCEGYEG